MTHAAYSTSVRPLRIALLLSIGTGSGKSSAIGAACGPLDGVWGRGVVSAAGELELVATPLPQKHLHQVAPSMTSWSAVPPCEGAPRPLPLRASGNSLHAFERVYMMSKSWLQPSGRANTDGPIARGDYVIVRG